MNDVQAPMLYLAEVGHARQEPVVNRFKYRTFYWLIDVDEPPKLAWPLRPLARFDSRDHLDIRGFLSSNGIGAHRIFRLAHARSFRAAFNPISVYWCYDRDGTLLAAVAEVHNTYGDRHAYLLDLDENGRASVAKQMYVSPFYPVDGTYDVRLSPPEQSVSVSITLRRPDGKPFVATLHGERLAPTFLTLLSLWLQHPWTPLRDSLLIRRQGLRLWRRGLEIHPR